MYSKAGTSNHFSWSIRAETHWKGTDYLPNNLPVLPKPENPKLKKHQHLSRKGGQVKQKKI
jgi:hypothetical protein